jgi:hypothetical protein
MGSPNTRTTHNDIQAYQLVFGNVISLDQLLERPGSAKRIGHLHAELTVNSRTLFSYAHSSHLLIPMTRKVVFKPISP